MKEQIQIEGTNFKLEDFSEQSLENRVFNSCGFASCNFSQSILRNAKFCSCKLENCNLCFSKVEGCRFQDVQFIDCKLVGLDFFKCDKTFFYPIFKKCLLQACNFSDLNMKNISFGESKLRECHFTNTQLNNSDFTGTDLSGTIFHNCNLSAADFTNATQYYIDPQKINKIKKAKFSLPEALELLRVFDITIN